LGEGQFGEVFKGSYTPPGGGPVGAAIKMCKPDAGNKELVEFLQEAAIMGQFDHPHIIRIFGCVLYCCPPTTQVETMYSALYRCCPLLLLVPYTETLFYLRSKSFSLWFSFGHHYIT
jgi:serine/threonine protein kinase